MKKVFMFIIVGILIIVINHNNVYAQDTEIFNKDIKGIQQLLLQFPFQTREIEKINSIFDYDDIKVEKLGFDGSILYLQKSLGYSNITIILFAYKTNIFHYDIRLTKNLKLQTNDLVWVALQDKLGEYWIQQSGPKYEYTQYGFKYEKQIDNTLLDYKKHINIELGEFKTLNVAKNVREIYHILTSPYENSIVGQGCDAGGSSPEEKYAMETLIKHKQIKVIENILKGYNPGGRIYATIALLALKKKGIKLNKEVENAINKVIEQDVTILTCSSCTTYKSDTKFAIKQFEDLFIVK